MSKTGDVSVQAMEYADKQLEQAKAEEHRRKSRLIKFGSLAVFAAVIAIFSTIAWFTMNKETEAGGLSMAAQNGKFEIAPVGKEDGRYDGLIEKAKELAGLTGAMTWTVNADDNMGNAVISGQSEDKQGIMPGAEGMISFTLTPTEDVYAGFEFELYAYTYDEDEPDEDDRLALISSADSTEKAKALTLLNGHILLFREREEVSGKYRYSGLIKDADSLKRLYEDHAQFTEETEVSIYWVWPETLSQITLDANDPNLYGKQVIYKNASTQTELLGFIGAHPECFFENGGDFTGKTVKTEISTNYESYNAEYNNADQLIGTTISYLLMNMNAYETSAG